MKQSRSEFIWVRGMRYHLRRWGADEAPLLVMLHGWLDVSASYQFIVDAFESDFQVVAPDWRGFGYSGWSRDGYWFADYVADLDAILKHLSPDAPVKLVGHSMGAQAASLFAGVRPERVEKVVLLDGLNVPASPYDVAPKRFRTWLKEVAEPPTHRSYSTFSDLAQRVQKHNPALTAERADFIARHWAARGADGQIYLLADPKHRIRGPLLYREPESEAIWKQVEAPVLCIQAGSSMLGKAVGEKIMKQRHACFRDIRVETLQDAGHMLHHEAPEATAGLIEAFLAD